MEDGIYRIMYGESEQRMSEENDESCQYDR